MLVPPTVARCDPCLIEQVCNLHSRVGGVCLFGLSQFALILFQLLQVTLELEKRIVGCGLLHVMLRHLDKASLACLG